MRNALAVRLHPIARLRALSDFVERVYALSSFQRTKAPADV